MLLVVILSSDYFFTHPNSTVSLKLIWEQCSQLTKLTQLINIETKTKNWQKIKTINKQTHKCNIVLWKRKQVAADLLKRAPVGTVTICTQYLSVWESLTFLHCVFSNKSWDVTICTLTILFEKVQIHWAAVDFIHFCGCFINMSAGGSTPSIIPDTGSVLARKQTSSNQLEFWVSRCFSKQFSLSSYP